MVVEKVNGKASLLFANERVRLARADDDGRVSFYAYVHRTRTLHNFTSSSTMMRFAEHMGLMADSVPLSLEDYQKRMIPFIMRKWAERCTPGMSYEVADKAIHGGHIQVRGTGIMQESTWTEFDDEVWFLAPKGIIRFESDEYNPEDHIEIHTKGNGWTYEPIVETIFRDLVEMFT